jgi:hypothetical protein
MKCVVCGCDREEHMRLKQMEVLASPPRDTDFLGDYMPEPPAWMDERPEPEEEPEGYDETVEPDQGSSGAKTGSGEPPLPEANPSEPESPEDDIPF